MRTTIDRAGRIAALDTSVCVPALLSWHEHHHACRDASVGARLPVHVIVDGK